MSKVKQNTGLGGSDDERPLRLSCLGCTSARKRCAAADDGPDCSRCQRFKVDSIFFPQRRRGPAAKGTKPPPKRGRQRAELVDSYTEDEEEHTDTQQLPKRLRKAGHARPLPESVKIDTGSKSPKTEASHTPTPSSSPVSLTNEPRTSPATPVQLTSFPKEVLLNLPVKIEGTTGNQVTFQPVLYPAPHNSPGTLPPTTTVFSMAPQMQPVASLEYLLVNYGMFGNPLPDVIVWNQPRFLPTSHFYATDLNGNVYLQPSVVLPAATYQHPPTLSRTIDFDLAMSSTSSIGTLFEPTQDTIADEKAWLSSLELSSSEHASKCVDDFPLMSIEEGYRLSESLKPLDETFLAFGGDKYDNYVDYFGAQLS